MNLSSLLRVVFYSARPHASAHGNGRAARLFVVPAIVLAALLMATGMVAILGQSEVAHAAPLLAPSAGDILYVVDSGGKTTGDCLRITVPITAPYNYTNACTLSYAVQIAIDGNTLRLKGGTYAQSIVLTRSLTLQGGYPTGFGTARNEPVANPAANPTFLIPSTNTPVVTIQGPITTSLTTKVALNGLQLWHTGGGIERAISLTGPVSPTISGLKIKLDLNGTKVQSNTVTAGNGGGINVDSRIIASIYITNTTFDTNKGVAGGAIYLSPGSLLAGSTVTFTTNEATAGGGGAIYASSHSTVTLSSVSMTSNKASGNGGALFAQNSPVTLNGAINNSTATSGLGGALYLTATTSMPANFSNLSLSGNKATSGGGIYATNIALTLSAGALNNNEATTGSGGALNLSGGAVTIGALPITNNKAAMHGGGIFRANGNLTLSNNSIMTNTATGGSGGGIAMSGSFTATLTGIRFLNNKAGGAGGGAYLGARAVTVGSSVEIRNNQAQSSSGGGLYIAASGAVTLTNNPVVRDNQSAGFGGGFYVLANSATIMGNTMLTNTAAVGGGLYLSGTASGSLAANTIQYNRATNGATGNGGGLFLNNAKINVSGLNLSRNTAQVSGGGLYANNSKVTSSGAVTFTLNTATTGSGGGAYLATNAAMTATTASFTVNTAQVSGGALYADQSAFVANTSSTAISNTATTANGGAFYFNNSQAKLGAVILLGNKATNGGALYGSGSTLSGTTLTAERNTATTGNGGALSLQSSTVTWSGANTVRYNKANVHGGAIYLSAAGMQVNSGATVISNTVTTGSGGALYLTSSAGFTVTGLLDMEENIAKVDGGGIFVDTGRLALAGGGTLKKNTATTGNGGAINFDNSTNASFGAFTIQSNNAKVNGGAVRAQASTLLFTGDTSAISNTATTGNGGAFYLTVGISTTFSQKLTLSGNSAKASGGGIYAQDTALSFGNNSQITDNQAITGSGGGIFLNHGALTTAKISFLRNKAKVDGGGLYAINGAVALANASLVQLNQAQTGHGGGIYAGGGSVTLTGVTVELNSTQVNGGGLYLTGNPLTTALVVQGSSIIHQNTSSTAKGGGLFVTGGTVTIDNSTVNGNQAQTGGGGLYQTGGTLTLTNTAKIDANKTITGAGGGLAMITGTVNILNSQVTANSSYGDGGGLYAPGSQVKVTTSTFGSNVITFGTANLEIDDNALAIARGGGIYVDGINVIIDNSTFTNNKAVMGGGGVYAKTLFAHIGNSQLNGNNGGRGGGGGVYLAADLAEVLQSTFATNQTAGNGGALAIEDTENSKIISNTLTGNFVREDIVVTTTVLAADIKVQQTGQIIKPAGTIVTGQDSTEGTGGGLHFLRSTGIFRGNRVWHNKSNTGEGGGLYLSSSTVTMTNNIIAQNSIALSSTYASGIYVNNTKLAMIHNTVADNDNASTEGGALNVGIYVTKSGNDTSAVQFTNNIISGQQIGTMLLTGNTAGLLNNLFFNDDEDWGGTVEYVPASGNKTGDPLFVDSDNDNYAIQRTSAAFDIGTATSVGTDIEGAKRPRAFGADAGAYEQHYAHGVHFRVVATPPFVGNGEQITYQIQVVNHSPVQLTGVSVNITLPSQQTSGGGCSACNIGTMAPEQTKTINLVTTASGTPPAQGFIEMQTTVNVAVSGATPGSTTDGPQTITTRLQKCRIRYNTSDFATFSAAMGAVNTADDLPDIIKVSGYCGGGFELNKKLTIQGGWNFPMTVFDPVAFPTTIDGGGSGRVIKVTGDATGSVENIILRGGNASGLGGGPSGKDAGGVLYITGATPTFDHVRITGGRAAFGAGVYVDAFTAPTIKNSIIESGQAGERGGGVYANNGSPILTNDIIQNNTAGAGGGVYLYKSEAKIVGCTINSNRATGDGSYLQVAGFNIRFSVGGGGGVNFDESKASINGGSISHNTAKAGGAVFADNSPGSVTGAIIDDNEANGSPTIVPILVLSNKPGGGGAIYAQRSDMVLEGNQFTRNRATAGPGGAIHIFNGSADGKINTNYFGFNSAGKGSAVYAQLKPDTFKIFVLPLTIPDFLMPLLLGQPLPDPPKLTFINNTFAHNAGGSVINLYGETSGEMTGNLFAFNSGTGVVAETQVLPYLALIPVPIIFVIPIPFPVFYIPTAKMHYTMWYQNGGKTSSSGVGASVSTDNDIDGKDPAFKNDGFHIKRISFAYNAGKNVGLPTDIDGQTRPQADITDMGADEYPAIGVRYVAVGGVDTATADKCKNFLNPCGKLQDAIDAASAGDLIKMAGGTYSAMATRNNQKQLGYITKTLTIQGGYYRFTTDNQVTEGLYTANDWEVPFPDSNPTILDGTNSGRIFFVSDEKRVDDQGNPITVEPVFLGLSLKNGNSTGQKGPQGNAFDAGGAIYLDKVKASIINVDITNSTADFGGAVYMISSTLTLSDVVVKNNSANNRGGGFYLETSNDVAIRNIVIESNKAPRGGGLYLDRSSATIAQNQIRSNGDNATTLEGGGIYLDNSPANIISNTINANIAANGGGFYALLSNASFLGNTITNNKALNNGEGNGRGGGCFAGPGSTTVSKNIFQNNQAIFGAGCFLEDSGATFQLNQFLTNIATNSGGAFYLSNSSSASVLQNSISGNRANGSGVDQGGGGLYLDASNATVRQNNVSTNVSTGAGGGLYLASLSNATVQENGFNNNTATLNGGGIYVKLSDAQISENIVTANKSAQANGGGVYVRLGSTQLVSNTIEQNTAVLAGGGVYLDQTGASLDSDSVRANSSKDGAGIYVFRSDSAKFTKVIIEQNHASQFGGGVYIRLSSVPFEDQTIANNFAQVAGGGVYIDESAVNFNRNIVRNNEAGQQGGGVAITRRSLARMASNAVIDNRAGNTGSGIYVAGSQPTLIHTTIARNVGGDGTGVVAVKSDGSPSTVALVNTILANQSLAVSASTGNTITLEATLWDSNGKKFVLNAGKIVTGTADLNFDGAARFAADGFHLQNNSRAIGIGIVTVVTLDIDSDGRPQGNGPELGADEIVADCAAVVDKQLNTVYTKVQDAIDHANPGDEVRISGTCVGAQLRAGTLQLAYVDKQITVRGGYTPTNWLLSYPITQPTFLDAQGKGRVFFIAAGKNPTIERLNLSSGSASSQGGGPGGLDAGGDIYVQNANPILRDLSVSSGAAYYGAGLYLEGSTTSLTNSKVENNIGSKGGGIFLVTSAATLRNNEIGNNVATDGGGIYVRNSKATIEGNALPLNRANSAGGAIFLEKSNAIVRGNGIVTNTAQNAGGIYVDGAAPTVVRNIVNANTGQTGGGIYFANSTATVNGNQFIANTGGIGAGVYIQAGNPTFDNNVVAKNVAQIQAAGMYILDSSPKLRQNTIAANTGGDGSGLFISNLDAQPSNIDMVNNIIVDHTIGITLTAGNKITIRKELFNKNVKDWGGNGIVDDKGGHTRADPLFVNPDGNDYHLQAASAARDKGASDAGVNIDYDNQTRPADNGFDIGADEFVFTGIQVYIQTVPDPVVAGADFQLIVTVINIGNIDQNAKITVTLPSGMTPTGVLPYDALIHRAETWVQTINAKVNPGFSGALKIKADVTTTSGASTSLEASIDVIKPDFAIALVAVASPSPVPAGAELTYQIRVNNVGNQPLKPSVSVELPVEVTAAAQMTFDPGALGPSGAWTKLVRTTVAADATGNLTAVFHATTVEGPTADYTLTVPIAEPSLVTSVSATPDPILAGGIVTYTLHVTNTGNIDFTNVITFVAPVDKNGRPLLAPGADQVFKNVAIPAGTSWTQTIVAVVQPGYVGPLISQDRIDTQTGLIIVYDDTRQVILPKRGPTIIAVNTGAWDNPNTWKPKRVPNAADIALVNPGVTVTVDGGKTNPIVMTGLINQGAIMLNCVLGVDAQLNITDFLENPGLIRGRDGQAIGEPGCGITVTTNELNNTGTIRAGDGMDGAVVPPNNDIINGGDGGDMNVFAQSVVNDGLIRAGDGGDLLFPATSGNGGDGGNVLVAAGPPFPALVLNSGIIEAGDGGKGPGKPAGDGRGGNGGSASVFSASQYINDGGEVNAGDGGDGDGDGQSGGASDGNDGASSISAAFIWDNGVMSATGRAFDFNTLSKPLVRGVAGATVLLPVTFINSGLRTDNYILIWANSQGWQQDFLPQTTRISGLHYGILFAPFTIPPEATAGTVSQVQLSARSQGDPNLVHERTIRVLVAEGGKIFLPTIVHGDDSQAGVGQDEQVAPAQPAQQKSFLPIIGD